MKTLTIATVSALMLASNTSFADGKWGQDSTNIHLHGFVPLVCELDNSRREHQRVDLNTTEQQVVGAIMYKCNARGGFERTISSENQGKLVGRGGEMSYTLSQTGGSGIAFTSGLSAPLADTFPGSQAFANGQRGTVRFQLDELPDGVFAGYYGDKVTFSITAL